MTSLQMTQRFLARQLAIDEGEIKAESPFDRLGIDSLAKLELLFQVEDEFGIRFALDDERITTVGELAAVIDRQRTRLQGRLA